MFGQNLDTVTCIRYIRFLCSNLAAWQLNVKSKLLNQGEKKKETERDAMAEPPETERERERKKQWRREKNKPTTKSSV